MPIYEYACPKCRRIFSFLSKRVDPDRQPACPKCGYAKLLKQVSGFAMLKGAPEPAVASDLSAEGESPGPEIDDARMEKVMSELERDMDHLDENNPRHVAHMMKKMKEIMPEGTVPKELDVAIRRLEKGEDPEKVEEDMGEALDGFMGGGGETDDEGGGGGGPYSRDAGLYDY